MVASEDPKKIAAEAFSEDDGLIEKPPFASRATTPAPPKGQADADARATTADQAIGHAASTAMGSASVGRATIKRRTTAHLADAPDEREHLALDAAIASWPFLLVQGLMLSAFGYFLRGCVDRRARARRLLPVGKATGRL